MNKEINTIDTNLELIKQTICKGATDQEFELFAHICKKTGLDPFSKQIYPVFRWDKTAARKVMTIQTSIDGYRVIAERTGCYAPGKEIEYRSGGDGHLLSATAYVKKLTKDGTWHEVAATAFWAEYAQTSVDKKSGETKLSSFWIKMPYLMLGKCAESLALRKAFPAELSGLYTQDEMTNSVTVEQEVSSPEPNLDQEQVDEILELVGSYPDIIDRVLKAYQVKSLYEIPQKRLPSIMKNLKHILNTLNNPSEITA